jgi:tRNA(His) 5'-end guanylyltransferase
MEDLLGARMKRYEQVTRGILLPNSITILRVDGRAFHSYLRGAAKPFDMDFIEDMQEVGRALCSDVSGTLMAYGQSDEISLIISDKTPQSEPWFGGVVQKMASVAAAVATASLILQRGTTGLPTFDARVFTVPTWTETKNYLIWRQRDAIRNSILMLGQAYFSHQQLNGKNTNQIQEMLFQEHGVNWSDCPDTFKRGWVLTREVRETTVTYIDKRDHEERTVPAQRHSWDVCSPHITIDYAIGGRVPSPETPAGVTESTSDAPGASDVIPAG